MNERLLTILNYLSEFSSEKSKYFGTHEQRKEHEEKAAEIYKILVEEIVDLFVESRVNEETSKICEENKPHENNFDEFYKRFLEDPHVKATVVHELIKPKWGLQEVSMDDIMYGLGCNLGSADIQKVLKEARFYIKEAK